MNGRAARKNGLITAGVFVKDLFDKFYCLRFADIQMVA